MEDGVEDGDAVHAGDGVGSVGSRGVARHVGRQSLRNVVNNASEQPVHYTRRGGSGEQAVPQPEQEIPRGTLGNFGATAADEAALEAVSARLRAEASRHRPQTRQVQGRVHPQAACARPQPPASFSETTDVPSRSGVVGSTAEKLLSGEGSAASPQLGALGAWSRVLLDARVQ